MADHPDNIVKLYQKWVDQTATDKEQQQLLQLMESAAAEEELSPAMKQVWNELELQKPVPVAYTGQQIDAILNKHAVRNESIVRRIPVYRRWWVAASVALLLISGAYWWFGQSGQQTAVNTNHQLIQGVQPGKEGAILTLADGTQLTLDSAGNGIIADQDGTQVLLKNGQLSYDPKRNETAQMVYNTMTTPKGRQFTLLLPDGTKVWLNAASSLKYPAKFIGGERRVEVNGEAYFEIAKNASQPFIVNVKDQAEIEVLGTRFNVNAYENEGSINTMLLDGSVKVKVSQRTNIANKSAQKLEAILKPGQQAQIVPSDNVSSSSSVLKVITDPNIDKVMAWKNGVFNFEGSSLAEVMRQLERWYDIEVVYEKGIPDIRFGGEISRGVSLEGLIEGLQASEVHFRIEEGKRLVVMP